MEYLKEANKNLISLRSSLITTVVVLSGGLVGLYFTDVNFINKIFFIILGLYFDFLFVCNVLDLNKEIKRNIGALRNECK